MICRAHISTLLGAQGANPETTGASPFSFTISVLGTFTCVTQHTGPTAHQRTKQLWLSVLLKDTSAATGQAGIRTHILTAPELESNALDRSTLQRLARKFRAAACAFTMDLYRCVTHLPAITADGKLACLSPCLTVSRAMEWKTYSKQKPAAKWFYEIGPYTEPIS